MLDGAGDIFLEEELKASRHQVLGVIEKSLMVPTKLASTDNPESNFGFSSMRRDKFEVSLPVDPSYSFLSYVLPLPQIGKDWGLASLLRNLCPMDFQKIINIILLERSIVVVGKSSIDVSAAIFALMELLKPFQWAGAVIPILPNSMFEILDAPVPFLVGVAGDSAISILNDERISEAMQHGLSLVNLDEGYVVATPEDGISDILLHTCKSVYLLY